MKDNNDPVVKARKKAKRDAWAKETESCKTCKEAGKVPA